MSTKNVNDNAGVVIFPPFLYMIFLIAGISVNKILPFVQLPAALIFTGVPFMLSGLLMLISAARTLTRHNTAVNPGGSTTAIVTTGLFRKTRNPMYISFSLIYAGISIFFNSWLSLALIIPLLIIVQRGIVQREEKYLLRKFGSDYRDYQSKVKRWV